jgi:phosphoribosyl 1,2-cyclic phosphate phosphodiesterase
MELIFLGTGTSEGVPVIMQPDTIDLDLHNVKNWRTRTSIHVVMNEHHIQVDAGPDFRIQCIHNSIRQIDTFILTHGHSDHVMGMDDLRRFCRINNGKAIPVYGHKEGLKRIRDIYPYAIRDKADGNYPAFILNEIPNRLKVPGGDIYSFMLPHGNFEVLGLVFVENKSGKKLAYFTDCKSIPENAVRMAESADVVILDALRHRPHFSHMNITEAIAAAKKIGGKQTWFVHMCCEVDHERDSKSLPIDVSFAWDGLRYVF